MAFAGALHPYTLTGALP